MQLEFKGHEEVNGQEVYGMEKMDASRSREGEMGNEWTVV